MAQWQYETFCTELNRSVDFDCGPTGMVPLRQQTMRAVAAYEGDTRTEGFFEKGERAVIKLKRAYDSASNDDGIRFLVERLWPRGVKKAALRLDAWLKDVAPSTGLRQWFSHDPAKWIEFQRRYRRELDAKREALEPILKAARRGRVTLVYSSHDAEHNNAVVLKAYLAVKMSGARRCAASGVATRELATRSMAGNQEGAPG